MNNQENSCSNNKTKIFSDVEKKVLLQMVLTDTHYEMIKNSPKKINEAFDVNVDNIIIATSRQGVKF